MGAFRKYNGKEGLSAIYHTSTGYKCLAKIDNPEDIEKEIYFYAKHIVGKDGRPYTEFGFESNETFDTMALMLKAKELLTNYGFEEVLSIGNTDAGNLTFSEYANPIPNVLEFRANSGKFGVMKVFEAMSHFIAQDCVEFVLDQEDNVEENLYLSILDSMGDELRKGPGGADSAQKRAREMADMFLHGISYQA